MGEFSMKETVSTMDLRQKLGDILNRVDLRHEQFIVERKGRQMAAIIPMDLFNEIQDSARKHMINFLDGLSTSLSDEKAMSFANEIKKEARSAKRKRR